MVTREALMASTFVELADTLVDDFDVVELLAHLTERCVELFDAGAAGLLVADDQGILRLMAATSEAAELVEVFQVQHSEGPCFDCYRGGEPIQVDDLAGATDRWPRFAPVAVGAGFRSAHALPLRLRGTILGALNLFRATTGRLEPSEVAEAQALTDVATIGILQHQAGVDAKALSDQLQLALHSRIAIEQAKGIVAEACHVDMDEAFARIRGHARRNRLSLSRVAQDIISGWLAATDVAPTEPKA